MNNDEYIKSNILSTVTMLFDRLEQPVDELYFRTLNGLSIEGLEALRDKLIIEYNAKLATN